MRQMVQIYLPKERANHSHLDPHAAGGLVPLAAA